MAIWSVVGLYLATVVLLHIPSIQTACGRHAASLLSKKLGTRVCVDRVDLGFLNRIIVDGLLVADQSGKPMLRASRFSVKIDFIPLTRGEISISSAQLFGLQANLYQANSRSKPNFQFVIDSLAPKDTSKQSGTFHITSVVVRHGAVRYDRLDIPETKLLSASHLSLRDISAHIVFNELTDDSINLSLKNISFKERSGLVVKSFSSKLVANTTHASLEDFQLELPKSRIVLKQLTADYQMRDGTVRMPTLSYRGKISPSQVTPSDLAFVLPSLRENHAPVNIIASLSGTSSSVNVSKIHLQSKNELNILAKANIKNWAKNPDWNLELYELRVQKAAFGKYLPKEYRDTPLARLDHIQLVGYAKGTGQDGHAKGTIRSNVGDIKFEAALTNGVYKATAQTSDFDLATLLGDKNLGLLSAKVELKEFHKLGSHSTFVMTADFPKIDFKGYTYHHILIDGNGTLGSNLLPESFDGMARLDDPNGSLALKGKVARSHARYTARIDMEAENVNLSALNITQKWPNRTVSLKASAQGTGSSARDVAGQIGIKDIFIHNRDQEYALARLELKTGHDERKEHFISVNGDFGNALAVGTFDYNSIVHSIENVIIDKLPGIQQLTSITKRNVPRTSVRLYAEITKADWARFLFGIPLSLQRPIRLSGTVNSEKNSLNINVQAPNFTYDGNRYHDNFLHLQTPDDTLWLNAKINRTDQQNKQWTWDVQSAATNDHLHTLLSFDNHARHPFRGTLNTETQFFRKKGGEAAAHVTIHTSDILVEDSLWTIEPSDIIYSKDHLTVDHFAIHHDDQHVIIAGMATKNPADTLVADLKDVDVSYMLNLINFDAVAFDGRLSGRAFASGVFGKPQGSAKVQVSQFRFETGRMGVLDANVQWNEPLKQIDIQSTATDQDRQTDIHGYVSPARNYLDLAIDARNTRLEFLQGFCGSFMQDVNASGNGSLRLYGDLQALNLTGQVVADGSLGITPLNTHYTLRRDTIALHPDEIVFKSDTVYDRNGNIGIVSGTLRHDNLTNLRYNLDIASENLLAFDTHTFGGDTFYGTAYVTGNCTITGKSGEVTIDVNATPQKGSQIVYNAAGKGTPDTQDFIKWSTRNDSLDGSLSIQTPMTGDVAAQILPEIPSNLHLNLLINCTPDATLKVIMDSHTGDYIALNGNGVLRAAYYNKGAFEMFGNYVVDHGVYGLTVQNIIKKDFQFEQGGTIAFGGDPYHAALNLKALYTVNGVSLADLNIGRSFTSNNIRVNCLMDITGTPSSPRVDFSLDLPTINNDAKQMVYSLINSEEEMNQQVLYLLAVGRFYAQGANNAASGTTNTQPSQASLAMQSILSGTLSQQLNNVLSSVINSNNWNFGANISTGTEGFNNAEYEGLLSGRLLNNRLLINGQFGYRDNPNATTSFIGDFDIRYLLFPNGNLAVKVYNQTNDRYFTRNSLTTQGVGLILKKDFTNLKDLFGRSRKKRATAAKPAP